jgi:hypothetical protein
MNRLQELVLIGILQISGVNWEVYYRYVFKVEQEYWERGGLMETRVEQLLLMLLFFWVLALCRLISSSQHLRGTYYCFHLQG